MVLTFQKFEPASWFSPIGALKKATAIRKRGLPCMKDGRFITLTLDRSLFASPEIGYEVGNGKLRRMACSLRKQWGYFEYGAKMEFHPDDVDWVHWHLLVPIKQKIDLDQLRKAWGLGRVNVKRVAQKDIDYIFKYAAKGLEDLPEWAAKKTRMRFWSTSQNFYILPSPVRKKPKASPRHETIKRPQKSLGERLKESQGAALLLLDTGDKKIRWKVKINSWLAVLTAAAQGKATAQIDCHLSPLKITAANKKDILWLLLKNLPTAQLAALPNCLTPILSNSREWFCNQQKSFPENQRPATITTWLKPCYFAAVNPS